MWYKSQIRFQQFDMENLSTRTLTERYLHKAVSFADVEEQLFKLLGERLSDFHIKAIAEANITQVYLHDVFFGEDQEPDGWYKCKVETTIEGSRGEEKVLNETYLITAGTVPQAHSRIESILKDSLIPFEIIDVGLWDIEAVNHLDDSSFVIDIKNRIARLPPQNIEPAHKVGDNQLGMFPDDEMPGPKRKKKNGKQKAAEGAQELLRDMKGRGISVGVKRRNDPDHKIVN